jgi:hypothetical protein
VSVERSRSLRKRGRNMAAADEASERPQYQGTSRSRPRTMASGIFASNHSKV